MTIDIPDAAVSRIKELLTAHDETRGKTLEAFHAKDAGTPEGQARVFKTATADLEASEVLRYACTKAMLEALAIPTKFLQPL